MAGGGLADIPHSRTEKFIQTSLAITLQGWCCGNNERGSLYWVRYDVEPRCFGATAERPGEFPKEVFVKDDVLGEAGVPRPPRETVGPNEEGWKQVFQNSRHLKRFLQCCFPRLGEMIATPVENRPSWIQRLAYSAARRWKRGKPKKGAGQIGFSTKEWDRFQQSQKQSDSTGKKAGDAGELPYPRILWRVDLASSKGSALSRFGLKNMPSHAVAVYWNIAFEALFQHHHRVLSTFPNSRTKHLRLKATQKSVLVGSVFQEPTTSNFLLPTMSSVAKLMGVFTANVLPGLHWMTLAFWNRRHSYDARRGPPWELKKPLLLFRGTGCLNTLSGLSRFIKDVKQGGWAGRACGFTGKEGGGGGMWCRGGASGREGRRGEESGGEGRGSGEEEWRRGEAGVVERRERT